MGKKTILESGVDCPSPEVLLSYSRGFASRSEKRKINKHVASCGKCLAEFRIMQGVLIGERELVKEIENIPEIRVIRGLDKEAPLLPRVPLIILSGATVLLLLVFIVFPILKNQAQLPAGQIRGGGGVITILGTYKNIVLPKWDGFRWAGIIGIDHYNIYVYDETLRTLWKSDPLRATGLLPTRDILELLSQGHSLSWQVLGYFPDGRTIKSNPTEIWAQRSGSGDLPDKTNPAQK